MPNKRLFLGVLLSLGVSSLALLSFSDKTSTYCVKDDPIKQSAFTVLEDKCNGCHKIQKPAYLFTLKNMDIHAADINKQVFIKKKMPKGEGNELTTLESAALRKWLDETLSKK